MPQQSTNIDAQAHVFSQRLLDNLLQTGCLEDSRLSYFFSEQILFQGGIVLAARNPLGDLCVLVGHFNGSGLPVVMGMLPLSDVFYSMVNKGFALPDVIAEVNRRLNIILPDEIFCKAAALQLDEQNHFVQIWNGGLPLVQVLHEDGSVTELASTEWLLGDPDAARHNLEVKLVEVADGDRILLAAPSDASIAADVCEQALSEQHTDWPCLKLTVTEPAEEKSNTKPDVVATTFEHFDWRLNYELSATALKRLDPLPLVLQILMENSELEGHRSEIYTILAELFSNALEHGVLGLSSSLKASVNGFQDYYEARHSRLNALDEGFVRFTVEQYSDGAQGKLRIIVEDSGAGYPHQPDKQKTGTDYCGRGLPLLDQLCEEINHNVAGNRTEVLYRF